MRKLLITGASGFLGGHVFAQAEASFQCLGLYNTFTAPVWPDWRCIDLTDSIAVAALVAAFRPDVILHAAANSNIDDCEKNPQRAQAINVAATTHLVSAAQKIRARFIYVSSDMVFDGTGSLYRESDPTVPISEYGRTKLQAEEIVRQLNNFAIVRSALIYGRPRSGGTSFFMWMENRLRSKKPVPLYYDQFRSPILVDNLAEVLLELCTNDVQGTLHAGGANRIDRLSFGKQMCGIFGYHQELLEPVSMVSHQPTAPRPRDVSLNIERATSLLKTRLLTTEEGLSRLRRQGSPENFLQQEKSAGGKNSQLKNN